MQLLTGTDLALYYGERQVFSGVNLKLLDDSRVGIVGPNGAGKTSLFRLILDELEPDEGRVDRLRGLRLGYVPQVVGVDAEGTLWDFVMGAFSEILDLERAIASTGVPQGGAQSVAGLEAQTAERYQSLLALYDSLGGSDHEYTAERTALQVGLTPRSLATPVALASGGERTRAGLARALLSDPDLLLLDEPTNYLDFRALDWLEGFLTTTRRAFAVVSHDRYFLDRVTRETWEMVNGRLTSYPGPYSRFKSLKAEREERQRREHEKQQVFVTKERAYIERNRAGQNAKQARGRETRLARQEMVDAPPAERTVRLTPPINVARSGDVILRTLGLNISVTNDDGSPQLLLTTPDITLRRGTRTCIVGPNGSGKTTLLQTILGFQRPGAGSVSLGHGVQPGYLRQDLGDLPPEATVIDALREIKALSSEEARGYLARFLFMAADLHKRVSVLSGGERARLSIARLLLSAPNLLVLDEPTTHLDITSREAIEEVLLSYQGTLLFVSHDRRLIASLANQLWVTQDGAVTVFDGGFESWIHSSQSAPASASGATPHQPGELNRKEARRQRAVVTRRNPLEKTIALLEERSAEVVAQLDEASAEANVDAITELGVAYNRIQADLKHAWKEWAAQA